MSKILVVEDNPATRKVVCHTLESHGYTVLSADDGATAVALMKKHQPTMVLQDLILPDIDGFALVHQLRDIAGGSDCFFLAFSGFVSKNEESRLFSSGFDDFITKPIEPSRLLAVIETHMPLTKAATSDFGAGKHLIVADDDPLQLKLTCFRLARLGFTIDTASDGAKALDLVRTRKPDVLVSDIMMPQLDGFSLAMAVRQESNLLDLPIVLLTSSYVEASDRDLAQRAGATLAVARSADLHELIDALRDVLGSKPQHHPIVAETLPRLERERAQRVIWQLERHVRMNAGLARRCSALAAELAVLTGISDAVLKHGDFDLALSEALAACFDAGGVSMGALYLFDTNNRLKVRTQGGRTPWGDAELETFFGHEDLLRKLIAQGQLVSIPAPSIPKEVSDDLLSRCNASIALVVPLSYTDKQLGALVMLSRSQGLAEEDWRSFAQGVGNQIAQMLTMASAFNEKENAERTAREQAAFLRTILDNAPSNIIDIDGSGAVRFVNHAIGATTPEQLIGTSWLDLIVPEQREIAADAFTQIFQTGASAAFEVQLRGREESARWHACRLAPVPGNGGFSGAVLTSRDITDQRAAEAQLILTDRMASVGTLAAGVAHEVNNPLASIIANLDLVTSELAEKGIETATIEALRDAREGADRVKQIVRDLKIFSRSEEVTLGPTDLERVVESTLRMAWNEIRHRAKLVKTIQPMPKVLANDGRLGQVVLNLVLNAAQSMREGHADQNELRISTQLVKDCVQLHITDTGAGIPLELQSRMFTPFFTTKPIGVGTGLGLSICHRIVSSFGGEITFTSEVGKGTTFVVSLRTAEAMAPAQATEASASTATRRGRVLVIDDEPSIVRSIERVLKKEHDITGVSSVEEALKLLQERADFDVILCDLMMPQLTGMDLHAQLTTARPDMAKRMVFLTGGAFTPGSREFLDTVTNQRLEKPFDVQGLRDLVNGLVG